MSLRSLRVVILALCALVLSSLSTAQVDAPHNRFGIVEGFWFPEVTCDLGVGWERIIFNWEQHQPEKSDDWYTLNVDDRWLKVASDCDREVVAILKHTPAWATDGIAGAGVLRGLDLPIDDPENLWANFVHMTAEYYASRGVNRFIIWNEPDIELGTFGFEYEGELEDYFQLLKVAYLSAKRANPQAKIHLAGTTYWHDVNAGREPYMQRLVDRILEDPDAEANNYYFDVLSLHIYFRTDTVYDIINEMRVMLDERGLAEKRIWINETNAAPTNDPAWQVIRPVYELDLNHQAEFMIQSAVSALAAGAERIAAYKLYDQELPEGGESFGILSPATAQPRPAYTAWQVVSNTFDNVTTAQLERTDTANIVITHHSTGQYATTAWARTDQPTMISIPATSNKAYVIDRYGSITVLSPVDGSYTLSLPPAHCTETDGCFLGGNVVILMQPSDATIGDITVTEQINNTTNTLVFNQE